MKSRHFFKICLLLFLVSLSFSCSKGSGGAGPFIPDLSQQFKNTSTTDDDVYIFNPVRSDVASSTFTGVENNNTTGDQFDFAGSFQYAEIEFTFSSGSKNGVKYTGTISRSGTKEIITLITPTGGVIVLKN